jgi:hypothetical protein
LKDTFTVQRWLNQIGQENLSRNSLKRIQSVLSGIFKQAKRLGYYDGVNPVQDTAVNPHAARPAETYAYSLEEIQSILNCPSRTGCDLFRNCELRRLTGRRTFGASMARLP